jgi:ABC-type transport system involved in multi-copper enzyme maturation permease subunit
MVLPHFAWERIFRQRIVTSLMMLSLFWPLLCALFIYISNNADLLRMFGGNQRFLKIDGQFFWYFMGAQSGFALILASIAGPGLVSPDIVNNALPLYFSRPLTRADYILSRLIVLFGMMSLVTIVPGLLLFGMQIGMASPEWLQQHWSIGLSLIAGFVLHILLVSLVALTSSAYVKWRVVAGALVLAFFFVLAGVSQMINTVFRVEWASTLNPGYALNAIWSAMLGVDLPEEAPGAMEAAVYLLALCSLLVWLLARKLRPVEVVR